MKRSCSQLVFYQIIYNIKKCYTSYFVFRTQQKVFNLDECIPLRHTVKRSIK